MGGQIIHIGVDDSNHHTEPEVEEYIVAVASINPLDGVLTFRRGRRREELGDITKVLREDDLYYRSTSLPQELLSSGGRKEFIGNLAYATPFLTHSLILSIQHKLEKSGKSIPSMVKLHIDGSLSRKDREYMARKITEENPGLADLTIVNYQKRKHGFDYPLVLDFADFYANNMFKAFTGIRVDAKRRNAIKALMHPHFMPVPQVPHLSRQF